MSKKKYVLIVDEDHLEAMIPALDLATRLHLGQLNMVQEYLDFNVKTEKHPDRDTIEACLNKIRNDYFGFSRGQSHGIHNEKVSDSSRVLFDLIQVIRHRLAWDRAGNPPERDYSKMFGVYYDEPRRSSTETEMATIEPVEK